MARGYPDFLAVPKYSNFGYIYNKYSAWDTVAPGAIQESLAIAGPGITFGGFAWLKIDSGNLLKVTPRAVFDGQLVVLQRTDYWLSEGLRVGCDWFYQPVGWRQTDTEIIVFAPIRQGYSWGLSLSLQWGNGSLVDVQIKVDLYYKKVE